MYFQASKNKNQEHNNFNDLSYGALNTNVIFIINL